MYTLKRLARAAVPQAIARAERLRLLNEPKLAESICLDILEVEPESQPALALLVLSLCDQVRAGQPAAETRARELLDRFKTEYERAYYGGIVYERKAHAKLSNHGPHSSSMAFDLLTRAMDLYEKAEPLRPDGNDEAILRWNTCARLIMEHNLKPHIDDQGEPGLE